MSSMYIMWLIFYCDLLSSYPAVDFLSMWLNGIMAFTNSNSDSGSPWKIALWIFALAKLPPPVVNFTIQDFMVFLINLFFIWYFVHFETVYYPTLRYHIIYVFVVNPGHNDIFPLVLLSFWMCRTPVPTDPLRIPFYSSGNNHRLVGEF